MNQLQQRPDPAQEIQGSGREPRDDPLLAVRPQTAEGVTRDFRRRGCGRAHGASLDLAEKLCIFKYRVEGEMK